MMMRRRAKAMEATGTTGAVAMARVVDTMAKVVGMESLSLQLVDTTRVGVATTTTGAVRITVAATTTGAVRITMAATTAMRTGMQGTATNEGLHLIKIITTIGTGAAVEPQGLAGAK